MKKTSISNAKIGGTNFSGLDFTGYNVHHDRSFMLFIDDPELLERWQKEGVKIYEGPKNRHFTKVTIIDKEDKCQIKTQIRGEEPKSLDPIMYPILDICTISKADLVLYEYHWSACGKSGVKLYLSSGTFTINKKTDTSDIFVYFQRRKKAVDNYGKFNI